ncbi:flagellar assembly protein H [Stutzerimonas stutzeri]|uniref:flagellar assembly protein FliH n=1 Tax=Stutzerimonas stutzeri subgroup TaxID=578833 RepID=UPI0008AFDAEB|nr:MULTISPECIES: flagellar assembly protein FliH [Stutzerimonas stutzeri subgroup]OHC14442.1 MAG: flagellar assembly protein FliH [Pseudomonadales bacterium GWC2_63_15]MCQ2049066.1 flagellar assembly protein H [Stutzerimonas kunmingensis]PKR25675.1 flagellar assembly protein FliH [Stutzerimonas stutzeri]QQC11792.1 flagellar assembly protein H [Stutzerimonas stutzeri]UEG61363.1 flagellar assembly protein H [Stutzerimonas chloritidismutans]
MTVKVIKGADRSWRPFRFPPRVKTPAQAAAGFADDPAALQRAVADGFQEGIDKGYREGLEQGREAGHREGFQRGVEDGKALGLEEGRQQGRRAFDEAGQPLDRLIEAFEGFRQEYEQARREELLELVQKVARQVIRCELTLHPTQLLTLAEEALSAMPGDQEDVRIHLNPEECARIRELAPERAAAWRLVPDEKLPLGECRVLTAQAEADIGCQQRLDSCMETLAEHITAQG